MCGFTPIPSLTLAVLLTATTVGVAPPASTEPTRVPRFTAEVEPVHAIRGLPREVGVGRP